MNQLSFNTNNSTNNMHIGNGVHINNNNNNNGNNGQQQIYYINTIQSTPSTMNIPIYAPQQTVSQTIPIIIQPSHLQLIQQTPVPPQYPQQFIIPTSPNPTTTSSFHTLSVPQSTSLPAIPQNQYFLINHHQQQQVQTTNAVQYINQPQLNANTNTNNTNSNSNSNIGIPPSITPINNPFANIITTETHSHSNNNINNTANGQNLPSFSNLPAMPNRPRLVMTHTSWSSNDSIDNNLTPRTPLTPLTSLTPITPITPSTSSAAAANTSSISDSDMIITPSDCGTDQSDAFWPSFASKVTLKQNQTQPLLSPRHAVHTHTHHAIQNGTDKDKQKKRNAKKKADGASFSCEICGRMFKHKSNLKTHGRIHDVDAPQCKYCGKKFARESNLKQHERVHTNERPFKCRYCPKKFKQAHSLNDHLRTHTGERPFKCDVCDKAFAVKHNMLVHKRIHTGEKPYICTVCRKQYSSKSGLNSHKVKHKHYS